tara:strand:- start:641 stop:1627 length:987 start_codon:yes stop_codon:yes gene_type:complete
MEEQYLLEVDSSQRDVVKYPNPNDYKVEINRPMYNISQVKLISARIPLPQWTIDEFNNKMQVDGLDVVLDKRDYLTGTALATDLSLQLSPIAVTFNTNTKLLTFTQGGTPFNITLNAQSPAAVFGFVPSATQVASATVLGVETIVSEVIDIDGPTSLIMSLNGDDRDDIKNDLYIANEEQAPLHFFGRIITVAYTQKRLIDMNGNDDPVRHNFFRGTESYVQRLHIRFYCNNFKEVHPYNFKLRNHILKFEITCNLDKMSLTKDDHVVPKMLELPPPLDIGRFGDQYGLLGNKDVLIYGGSTVIIVIIVLILRTFRSILPRTSAAGAS